MGSGGENLRAKALNLETEHKAEMGLISLKSSLTPETGQRDVCEPQACSCSGEAQEAPHRWHEESLRHNQS